MYSVVDLGTLAPGRSSGSDINNRGDVVGIVDLTPENLPPGPHGGISNGAIGLLKARAFLWRKGRMRDLGPFPGSRFVGVDAINDSGQVLAHGMMADGFYNTFLWEKGRVRDLGRLGDRDGGAHSISKMGVIVGRWEAGIASRAFAWTSKAGRKLLTTPEGEDSLASGINDRGEIVGAISRPGQGYQACVWRNGRILFLGRLGNSYSFADAVNNRGDVVGHSAIRGSDYRSHAFLWRKGKITDLGVLPGYDDSEPTDINDSGVVVGNVIYGLVGETTTDKKGWGQHPFLWKAGKMCDLNDLIPPASGWEVKGPSGINDAGFITGQGTHNGRERAYLLIPR
ncbi:MAG TPA: hypothetical protein VGM37_13600 [Armatimonadota bacterium]